LVRNAQLDRAVDLCETELSHLPQTDYHAALGRSFLTQTDDAARWLADFYQTASKKSPVLALYCEFNRLEINPDNWYLDAFAYDSFGDPKNLGWLVGWKQNSGDGRFTLRGTEDLQALFARDVGDEPPESVQIASEVVTLLLALRMQELICAASQTARQSGTLPDDIPVLAAAQDSDLACCFYGSVMPPVTRPEPARPAAIPPRNAAAGLAIYRIDGGYDELYNSLPWDLLNYSNDSDFETYRYPLDKAEPLAQTWTPPRVSLRKRKWRCDLISLYPHWAVNEKARAALWPLLHDAVEFLPLDGVKLPQLWVMHPLIHIDLAPNADHNGRPGDNITTIHRFTFEVKDLRGQHLFGVKQASGSDARKSGYCFAANFVSEEFQCLVATNALQGVVFEKVFSYPTS